MKKTYLVFAMLLATAVTGCKDDDDDQGMNQTDRDFIMQAGYINNSEIDAGTDAASRGNNAAVRSFGQMMVMDHTMARSELQNTAQQMGQSVPAGLDSAKQAVKQYLSGMSGYSFDTAYIHAQVKGHQEAINLMQREMNSGNDQRLKDYASKYLPVIQMHHHMADSISSTL